MTDETMVARFAQACARDVEPVAMNPCPWCGGEVGPIVEEGATFRWRRVTGCCANGPEVRHDTLADDQAAAEVESRAAAIAAWNERPVEVTLRAQLEAAEAEVRAIWDAMPATLRYLDLPDGGDVPLPEQVRRMGEDVVNQQARAEAAEAEKREAWAAVESKAGWEWKKRAEAAEAEVARLGAVLDRIAGYTLSQFAGPCDMVVQCVHDAMAARTKEAAP